MKEKDNKKYLNMKIYKKNEKVVDKTKKKRYTS